MAIVQSLDSFSQFYDAIYDNRLDTFSRQGWELIYDHLTEVSESTGSDIEFDCIGICCEWSEYNSVDEFLADYDIDGVEDCEDDEEKLELIEVWLNDKTTVLSCDEDCILFADF